MLLNHKLCSNIRTNQITEDEIKISNEKIEIWTSIIVGPDASVREFWGFYEIDFDYDPETSYHPYDPFCHHPISQKIMMSGSI
jgi:hypothetical protein